MSLPSCQKVKKENNFHFPKPDPGSVIRPSNTIFVFVHYICKYSSIRNLRYLSPCSVIANIFEFVGLAVIAYYIFGTPLPRFDDGGDDGDDGDDGDGGDGGDDGDTGSIANIII